MAGPLDICVILPAYNEAENLPAVLDELSEILDERFEGWGMLVVDDGSTDDTQAVLDRLEDEHPQLQSIRLRRNHGKSEALRSAFEVVDADAFIELVDCRVDGAEFDDFGARSWVAIRVDRRGPGVVIDEQ